jgi:hypothetical protein
MKRQPTSTDAARRHTNDIPSINFSLLHMSERERESEKRRKESFSMVVVVAAAEKNVEGNY